MKQFSIILIILLIITAIVDLGVGIGYYTLLRFLVTFGAILWAIQFYGKNQNLFITFCIIAILFNPIIPIYLGRELWRIVDFITGIIFVIPLTKNNN